MAEAPKERLVEGLRALTELFRFQEMRTAREMEEALKPLAPVALRPDGLPPLDPEAFPAWVDAMKVHVGAVPVRLKEEELSQTQIRAWDRWNRRLRDYVLTREPRVQPTRDDLFCQVAGVPPAEIFSLDLRRMTLGDWSRLVELALGWRSVGAEKEHLRVWGPGQTPLWVLAPALGRAGLGSLLPEVGRTLAPLERLVAGAERTVSDQDRRELRGWIEWIADREPAWLEPRPSGVMLTRQDGGLTSSWLPSATFGGWLSDQPEALKNLSLALWTPRIEGRHLARYVFMVELLPTDRTSGGALVVPRDRVRWVPHDTRLVGVIREMPSTGKPPDFPLVVAPKSFDDAMEQALKLLEAEK